MGPGTAVGRLALLDDDDHSHRIVAEGATVCQVLTTDALTLLEKEKPRLVDALRWSIAQSIATRLRRADADNHALMS